MSIVVPQSGAIATAVHIDIRAAFGQYLVAFKASEPFRDILGTIKRHSYGIQRDVHGGLIALRANPDPDERQWAIGDALAIRAAIHGSLARSWEAGEALDELTMPPPEEVIRAMLAAMLKIMRAKPGEGGHVYIDGLVWEIMEPQFCGPAIAAACRETWQTQTFAPTPCELIPRVKHHQERVETARAELNRITDAWMAATECWTNWRRRSCHHHQPMTGRSCRSEERARSERRSASRWMNASLATARWVKANANPRQRLITAAR